MQFAIHNNIRKAAEPKLKGFCLHCNSEVIAKCGEKNIWHWAHFKTENCDSWSEPETEWHRNWKSCFGVEFSEIKVEKDNAYHIADVLNKNGIVFEFQNSPISAEVIQKREEFYGEKMIWIINGISFKENLKIYEEDYLRNWKFKVLDEFAAANYEIKNALIIEDWQVKQDVVKNYLIKNDFEYDQNEKIYYLDLKKIANKNREQLIIKLYNNLLELYTSYKSETFSTRVEFVWEHYRRSWQECKRPVFIDIGEQFLLQITSGMGKKYGSANKVRKTKFLQKYCV
jgi:hypothetical protein